MRTIWKYPLEPDTTRIAMPKGAKILTVQTQDNTPCVWALVDTSKAAEFRFFHIYGTGHRVHDEPGNYVGTWQADGLVWHLFEYTL